MAANEAQSRLEKLLREKAVVRGEVRLSSGRLSDYYIDAKKVTTEPEGLVLIGEVILNMIDDLECSVTAIGGLTLGADPIVAAVAYASNVRGKQPIRSFIVRKEPKKHGTEKMIEGAVNPGESVVIVDDVVTSGKSVLQAIRQVEDLGCKVEAVMCLVDRGEGGRERLAGYNYRPLCSKADLGITEDEESDTSNCQPSAAGALLR